MTWVRTEDDLPLHPKFLRLSDGAYRLWHHALSFANRATTDGVIAKDLVATLNHHGRWTAKQLAGFVVELVAAVLWVESADCYRIHDYEKHQAEAMRERVEERRAYEREKKRGQRGKPRGVPPDVPAGHTQGLPISVPGVSALPSRPVPSRPEISLPDGSEILARAPEVLELDPEPPEADAGVRLFRAYAAAISQKLARFEAVTPNRIAAAGVAARELERTAALRGADPRTLAQVAIDRWISDPFGKRTGWKFEIFARQILSLIDADPSAAQAPRRAAGGIAVPTPNATHQADARAHGIEGEGSYAPRL